MDLVQKGDGGEWQIFVRRQQGDAGWRMIADLGDECIRAVFGAHSLFLLSLRGAPRGQVLRLELDGRKVVKEGRLLTTLGERIRDVRQGPDGLLYVLTDNSDGRVLRLDP